MSTGIASPVLLSPCPSVADRQATTLTNEQLVQALKQSPDTLYATRLREEIVKRNVRLVRSIAHRFLYAGEPFDDLVQEGYIGLMKAIETFDYKRGCKFSTLAVWEIRRMISEFLANKAHMIGVPRYRQRLDREIKAARAAFLDKEGRPPTIAELAGSLAISESRLTETLYRRRVAVCISSDSDKEAPYLASTLKENPLPFDLRMWLTVAIEQLSTMKRRIIDGFFYQGKSPARIGRELGIPEHQVRQTGEQILNELKRKLVGS